MSADTLADDRLLGALRTLTGRDDATFREHQRDAVEALVDHHRVLVVQRTGWGKSAVYFLATHLLRQQGLGPTLLISPLLALMRNQIEAATRLGLRCMTVNSSAKTTVDELADALNTESLDLILVSPERLANPEFAAKVMPMLEERPGMMVIDEVHCISDWGHDFRPDYRRIGRMLDEFGRSAGVRVPILGCTATANLRVVDDVAEQLGAELTTFRGALGRSGLGLGVVDLPAQPERLVWLAERLGSIPGSGIIYCLTIRDTLAVSDFLQSRGFDVAAYSGATESDEREELERRLQANELKALVATSALGMGYDKPDLGFVIHFQMPGSPIAYYQQVGRAGRALAESAAILLVGQEDLRIQDHFINRAFPAPEKVDEVLAILDAAGGPVGIRNIAAEVNLTWGDIESILKQLDVEGTVRRIKGQSYERTEPAVGVPDRTRPQRHRGAAPRAAVDARLRGDLRVPHAVPDGAARRPGRRALRDLRQLPPDRARRRRRISDRGPDRFGRLRTLRPRSVRPGARRRLPAQPADRAPPEEAGRPGRRTERGRPGARRVG